MGSLKLAEDLQRDQKRSLLAKIGETHFIQGQAEYGQR